MKDKVICDPIYGYISIPSNYFELFIDNHIFQRLRRIEQTSMRVLYPSAHHDRFAHSLGVFHLGRIAFGYLKKNSEGFFSEISPEKWEEYRITFEIACLLHDCGHSPYSHTFEHYYTYSREGEIKKRLADHFEAIGDANFINELVEAAPSPHEIISSIVLIEKFAESIVDVGGNPHLAVKMITGSVSDSVENDSIKFENKLIKLLNGDAFDLDSLDYIQRDTWSSGVSNVNIDYNRLLSSLMIKQDKDNIPRIVFKKQALSVLNNIILGRNFLYKWIYSHHKVVYEQYLLNSSIERLNKIEENEFCKLFFSVEALYEPQEYKNFNFFLPTDDDLIHIMKYYYDKVPVIEEFFTRKFKYKAIWKTKFEFDHFFHGISEKSKGVILNKLLNNELKKTHAVDCICLKNVPKLKGIEVGDVWIEIDNDIVDAEKASITKSVSEPHFLLYVKEDEFKNKAEIIKKIRSLQR